MRRTYLSDIANNYKNQGERKIYQWKLSVVINFISSTDSDEISYMHTKSDNIEIMLGTEADAKICKKYSLMQKYRGRLGDKMRESEFPFDSVDLLHYNLHKISLNKRWIRYRLS